MSDLILSLSHYHRHIAIFSDVFSTVSVLSFCTIRVRALCVEEPQFGWISSGSGVVGIYVRIVAAH